MRGTTFAECTFQDVITPLSDFEEYVDSNVKFWQPFDLNEARLAFLRDYVETVREAVGTESMSYEILEGCRRRFATGNAAWTQEMRKLIEDVPYEEYEASSAGSLEIFYKYPVLE
ncbi:MAG: hypothetical protein KDA69_12695 [Planctomycetaceae bacterium]|nr:hypothetical protein [Planctomycetaceae bacterium]MCA9045176.1 hypothetical protein [Planctomycetaceae bacterium]